jgi:hypothetical protein
MSSSNPTHDSTASPDRNPLPIPPSPIAHAALNLSLNASTLFSHGGFQLPLGTLGSLTPFSGTEPVDRWLATFDLFLCNNAHVFDENEGLKLKVLRSAMSGTAAQFLQDLIQEKDNRLDGYEALRTLLVQRFTDPRTEAKKMRMLEQRKWLETESLRTYADDVERLCREAIGQCKESVRIFHFCNGLPKPMSQFVQLEEPSSLAQAVRRAQAHDCVFPRPSPATQGGPEPNIKTVAALNTEPPTTTPQWAEKMTESLESISSTCQRLDARLNMVERSMATAPPPNKKPRIERNDKFCDYCKIPGHSLHECRNRLQRAMMKLVEERPSLLEETALHKPPKNPPPQQ